VIAIAGSFLPWARNDWYSRAGTDYGGDGFLTGLLALGGVILTVFARRLQTVLLAGVAGALGFSIGLINYLDITSKTIDGQRAVEVGEGLYATMVAHAAAALIATGCALAVLIAARLRGTWEAVVSKTVEEDLHRASTLSVAAVSGFLLVAIGSFLPWFAFGNGTVTKSGIDGGDGVVTLLLAAAGAAFILGGRSTAIHFGAAAAGGLAFVIGVVNFIDIAGDLNSLLQAEAPVGNGVYLTMVGGLAATVASMALALGNHPSTSRATPRIPQAPGVL
jgi:hypothetical protein